MWGTKRGRCAKSLELSRVAFLPPLVRLSLRNPHRNSNGQIFPSCSHLFGTWGRVARSLWLSVPCLALFAAPPVPQRKLDHGAPITRTPRAGCANKIDTTLPVSYLRPTPSIPAIHHKSNSIPLVEGGRG